MATISLVSPSAQSRSETGSARQAWNPEVDTPITRLEAEAGQAVGGIIGGASHLGDVRQHAGQDLARRTVPLGPKPVLRSVRQRRRQRPLRCGAATNRSQLVRTHSATR